MIALAHSARRELGALTKPSALGLGWVRPSRSPALGLGLGLLQVALPKKVTKMSRLGSLDPKARFAPSPAATQVHLDLGDVNQIVLQGGGGGSITQPPKEAVGHQWL